MSTIPKEEYEELENILLKQEVKYWDWLRCKGTTPTVYQGIMNAMYEANQLATDGREEEIPDFKKELMSLLNRHSKESDSNTPDFILAEHLIGSLKVFCESVNNRNTFYVRTEEPDGREELENKLEYLTIEKLGYDELRKEIRQLYADLEVAAQTHHEQSKRISELQEGLRDFADNYDCDSDAHKYNTTCRKCKAKQLLK
jgi:hypothetical protein